ncbi:MAG TPA: DNA repair protein RecO [Verrucomicrobiae bacterium]|nr:DNA repair protein RecO [Verrucomicrobiae bacterium]
MIESATGIILRTRPLTDTSLIIHWLTPELGRLATVAKGARRAKSPFAGKLDLFYEGLFSFARSRKTDLHTLREIVLRETRPAIRENLLLLQRAAYAGAFIEQMTETETPLADVFYLYRNFLKRLAENKSSAQTIFAFELKLLDELGLSPDLDNSGLTAGTKKIASLLLRNDFAATENVKPAKSQVVELRQFLHGFLIFHLGKLPKGRVAALSEAI